MNFAVLVFGSVIRVSLVSVVFMPISVICSSRCFSSVASFIVISSST